METRLKAIKKRLNSFSGWKTILGVVVVLFFLEQLCRLNLQINHVEFHNPIWMVLIPLLTILAWWLEFVKWQMAFNPSVSHSKELLASSFKKGMLSGFLTPSAFGNFVGRISAFEKEQQRQLLTHTLLGNGAQFLASIGLGLIGYTLYYPLFFPVISPLFCWVIWGVLVFFYFRLKKVSLFRWKANLASHSFSTRFQLLALSLIRGLVFITQLSILLYVFSGFFIWSFPAMVALFYLFTTLSPSVFIGKLILRESIALWLFPILGLGGLNALVATIVLWLFNNGLSSLWALSVLKKKYVHA